MSRPSREIRAFYDEHSVRVYQAYSDVIADSALTHQTFVSPPFSMTRMTWIKPSFLWMMYRAGWGKKGEEQKRILAIDITHEGFAWAIANSSPSHPEPDMNYDEWRQALEKAPVRIQWDPERDLHHNPLAHRTIQIGLRGEAVKHYTKTWVKGISDETSLAHEVHDLVLKDELERARTLLPREKPYLVGMNRQQYLAVEREQLLDPAHYDHEEIVALLQRYPENESVPYLRKAILLKPSLLYLEYDDYGAFYKKCLWALQDIGTPEAIALIAECSLSDDPMLKDQALYRLKRIAAGRSGGVQFPPERG